MARVPSCAGTLFVLLVVASGCASEARPPGVVVPEVPVQTMLDKRSIHLHDDFLLERVARFEVRAVVLSAKRYRVGREAGLSPIDLALGWGPMSDQAVLDQLSISQFRRFYWWKARHLPIPRREIERNSANMHMIPATPDIADDLRRVKQGQVVHITGYLVNASKDGTWRWRTSLTRDDTGNGACELVFVEDVQVIGVPSESDVVGAGTR